MSCALKILEEMIVSQEEKVYSMGGKIIPQLTRDDLLQPNDFPELENHPLFRYEEGVLEGMRSALMALRAEESCG